MKTEGICLATAGLFLALVVSGCRERNPAYIQQDASPDLAAIADAPIPPDTTPSTADGPTADATGPEVDMESDGPDVAGEAGHSGDAAAPDTRDFPRDGRDARRPDDNAGPDAIADGAGQAEAAREDAGAGDLGVDAFSPPDLGEGAVDASPLCTEQETRACSSPGNPLLGACRAGTQTCKGGAWGACVGETLPASAEACNGIDDNCNGMTDEGCAADCVVVAPTGDDTTADGSPSKPFATLPAAMALANGLDGGAPKRVCVVGGATCAAAHVYVMDAPLVMASGGRIQGNYALANAGLSYCSDSQPPTTTLHFGASEQGVVFDQDVAHPSELSGFVIERLSPSTGTASTGPISAVSVSAAKGVTLSGIFVTDAPVADTTYGVQVESGGQVTIVGSAIAGGQGRAVAIGVYVNGGSVNLRNNCDGSAGGYCNSSCASGDAVLGIRGRTGAAVAGGAADSSAVYVTGTSSSPSTIVANNLCGGAGNPTDNSKGANLATLRCESGACATIAGNTISAGSGSQTMAVDLLGGPSLVDGNLIVSGCGSAVSTGVVLDDAPARLQNNRILGGPCTGGASSATFYGVHIVLGSSPGEPDLSSNDIDPMGSAADCQSAGVAVERSAGDVAAAGILRNNIISAGNCRKRFAVEEISSSTARIVQNNDLYPGPGSTAQDTAILYHRGSTDASDVAQVNALAGAAENISADPMFLASPTDLHLSSGSPCIDRGTAEGAPATDGDGNPRPAGAGFDIGAYESPSP